MIYISILIFLLYIIPIIIRYGIPKSLSETYYTPIGNVGFTFEMILLGLTMTPSLLDVYPSILTFAACISICLVGMSPYSDKPSHNALALCSGVLSQIIILINKPILLIGWAAVFALTISDKKRWLLYTELQCIISTFLICLL